MERDDERGAGVTGGGGRGDGSGGSMTDCIGNSRKVLGVPVFISRDMLSCQRCRVSGAPWARASSPFVPPIPRP